MGSNYGAMLSCFRRDRDPEKNFGSFPIALSEQVSRTLPARALLIDCLSQLPALQDCGLAELQKTPQGAA